MNRRDGTDQEQFLNVIDRDEAERRFHQALQLVPLGEERIPLTRSLGRSLSRDVVAPVDVPSFDRANLDGFAVRAVDTEGATEEAPCRLRLTGEVIPTAHAPTIMVENGFASPIATGGMIPRGADAIVMIEHTDMDGDDVIVYKSVAPGKGISFAGTDIGAGEVVLRRGDRLTSRETGVIAAIGQDTVHVWQRPRVAILSTGDEIIPPGEKMRPGFVFDSNARILSDAVTELGGEPVALGIVHDDLDQLSGQVEQALLHCDVVLLSGGTSKGAGDVSYRVVRSWTDPGIVAHGVALKPGKPICLAVTRGKPVIILPGFPTSAVFTFHEFVAPIIRRLAGLSHAAPDVVEAQMAVKVNSEIGRTEFVLVGIVHRESDENSNGNLAAYPMGKGSGSVTTFSRADGFVSIDRHEEIVEQGQRVQVHLLGNQLELADLVVIGSHCVGVDYLLGRLQTLGFRGKFLAVGSMGGLAAARRGECDVAGIHLFDATSGDYNRPFVEASMTLVSGYTRQQGLVFRSDDPRFTGEDPQQLIRQLANDPQCVMVNRNAGSGTRILIDQLLGPARPSGYAVQPKSHNAVAAAVAQGRADWGIAIERVARQLNLGFLPVSAEQFDFVIPRSRCDRPAVHAWCQLLTSDETKRAFADLGLTRTSP